MKQRIRQIINDMRRQPLISGVSFIATVMSVFLFMVVAILQRLQTIPFAPESCRDRLLVGEFFHYKSIDGSGGETSGGMSYALARQIYGGLDGVESEAFMQPDLTTKTVGGRSRKTFRHIAAVSMPDFSRCSTILWFPAVISRPTKSMPDCR